MKQTKIPNADSRFRRFLRSDEFSVLTPPVVIIFITWIFRHDFVTASNFKAMFTQIPF